MIAATVRRCPSFTRAVVVAALSAAGLLAPAACRDGGASGEPKSASSAAAAAAPSAAASSDDERAYADMGRTLGTVTSVPVRGRLVEEEGEPDLRTSTPAREASQDEIANTDIDVVVLDAGGREKLALGKAKSDDEGYINEVFAAPAGKLAPGLHTIEVRVKGAPAGRTAARLLDAGYEGIVARSDVDLTYLDTRFSRKRDMVRLLRQSAPERKTLPAMERVYPALRAGASGTEDRPLVFISGSPRFFKRVLEARMADDKVEQDGVILKAFDDIAGAQAVNLDFDRITPALKEQVAYKLVHLMNGRVELPRKAGEILLGDDSEADFIVYSIYHRFLAGDINATDLDKELERAGVEAGAREPVKAAAARMRAEVGTIRAVKAIYINRTGSPNTERSVDDWVVPGLTRYHSGAWPLILDMFEEGLVAKAAVTAVRARLVELGQSDGDLDAAAQAGVKSGFLQKETPSLR